jgi:hypothetical protein
VRRSRLSGKAIGPEDNVMVVVSLISFKPHLITQIATESRETFPVKVHIKSLEVMLIIVPIKKALEL